MIGILTDSGQDDKGNWFIRIDDKPHPVILPTVIRDLQRYQKNDSVEVQLNSKGEVVFLAPGIERSSEEDAPEGPEEDCTSLTAPSAAAITDPALFNQDQVALIKATVAKGCSQTEFELLMYLSAHYKLDPLRRQIWAVKYGSAPASIFTGRDGFLEIAHRSGQFDGMESGVRQEGDERVGWCRIYRKDMAHPFYVEVYESEYSTHKNLWQSKPRIMLQKVAESTCLRRAFSVSGLYSPEEMGTEMPKQAGAA